MSVVTVLVMACVFVLGFYPPAQLLEQKGSIPAFEASTIGLFVFALGSGWIAFTLRRSSWRNVALETRNHKAPGLERPSS